MPRLHDSHYYYNDFMWVRAIIVRCGRWVESASLALCKLQLVISVLWLITTYFTHLGKISAFP